MKKLIFSIIISLAFLSGSYAQELNCNVQVNADMVQGANADLINSLQTAMTEFVNNRRWTEMAYTAQERIECTMSFIFKSIDGENFNGELTVQARRPVYNSSYYTTLFNFRDNNISFQFGQFDQLEANQSFISSNLTAILTYYVYIIIGYDMDSFARLGGTPYFQAAENIVNMAQSSDYSGWKAFEDSRNRYALVSNLMDEAFKKYRNFFYEYHRLGLDEFSINIGNARARIAAGLPLLREANRARPSAIVVSSFLDAKNDELINIFSGATEQEKKDAVEILSDISPTNSARYEAILKN
ncbi:MAG: DUF4835 family protein [Prevotellaceae bacterium]|jgi:hypothetical protein|nr:DUF4835 family protein [Prevotellaceae bacterium]